MAQVDDEDDRMPAAAPGSGGRRAAPVSDQPASGRHLTGERPMEGVTPDSLLALHEAGYREVAARTRPGLVLDVGCGVGDESVTLAGEGRRLIGIDYSADTAVLAARTWGRTSPRGRWRRRTTTSAC